MNRYISFLHILLHFIFSPIGAKISADEQSSLQIEKALLLSQSTHIAAHLESIILKEINNYEAEEIISKHFTLSDFLKSLCFTYYCFKNIECGKPIILHELKNRDFVRWIATESEIFRELSYSTTITKSTLSILYKIWVGSGQKLNLEEICMALGAALLSEVYSPEECINKFYFYKNSHINKYCYSEYYYLHPWEWSIVFRGKESDEDLRWGQFFIINKQIPLSTVGNKVTRFIPYRKFNKKGISVHKGSAFYDYKPITLQLYTEYGGVCGAVSKGSVGFLRATGIPAWTIGQPGHCAFIWKHPTHHWCIGNNINGWNWSTGNNYLPWNTLCV